MRNLHAVRFVALLVPLLCSPASRANAEEDKAPKRYASPAAVFNAYREARGKREWRKIFSLRTIEAQNDDVFESFFALGMQDTKETRAIQKKYGLDDAAFEQALSKGYKDKYGIDIGTADGAAKAESLADSNRQLLVDVVATLVKDKPGFVEAAAKHSDERAANLHEANPVWPLGDLEHLVVQGDRATGSAKETILPRAGESPRKPGQPPLIYEKPFKFRRLNGGWLLDLPS